MRDISQDLVDKITNNRVLNARFTFRDTRLVFTARNIYETMVADKYNVDSCVDGTGIVRVAKKTSDNTLQYIWLDDPSSIEWDPWAQVGAVVCHADSSVGIEGSRCWYLGTDKKIYYVDFDSGEETWGAPVEVLDASGWSSTRIAFAPVGLTKCYVMVGPQTDPLIHSELKCIADGSVSSTFHGYVYGDPSQRYRFDAATAWKDYVFVVDRDSGRALFSVVTGNIWSDLQQVVPLDVVDDDNSFNLGGVAAINDCVFVTGRYKRGSGVVFDMYSIGPEHFSIGRDVYITSSFESDVAGKFHLIGETVYFLGYGGIADANATNLVGYDNAALKHITSDFVDLEMNFRPDTANGFSGQIKSDMQHTALRRGAEVTIEVGYGGEYGQIGVFGIDALGPVRDEKGIEYGIGGRGLGIKKLDQWASDQSYDYWSQAKLNADPSDFAEVIRTTGQWTSEDSILTLNDLNIDGYMYTTAKASRGASMRARFRRPSTSGFTAKYGVGVNYYRETIYEAATRLGIEPDDVLESQYGHNGVFAIWTGGTLYVYRVKNSVWTQLANQALDITADVWHWLQILFQDGYIRVLYRADSSTDWSQVLATKYSADSEPWFRDDVGRGALYVYNGTIASGTPGFNSASTIIPVDDTSVFPTSETVIVDNEQITYDGKATADDLPAEMTWADGNTFAQAEHNNSVWDNILLFKHEWLELDGEITVGKNKTECVYAGQAFRGPYPKMRLDKIRIPIEKVGSPTNNLYCYFVTDTFDNNTYPILSAIKSATFVQPAAVGTEYEWVEFDFTGQPEVDRWFDPNYGKSYWLFVTTMPPGSTDYDAYHNVANYYKIKLNETASGSLGIFRYWKYVGWYGYYQDHESDAIMPFEIYGKGPVPAVGYEIYCQGADVETQEDKYTNMALVCTAGPGAGIVSTIKYYDYQAPKQWVPSRTYLPPDTWQDHVGEAGHGNWVDPDLRRIFVLQRPNSFGEGSKFIIKPSLLVTQRGANETTTTSHQAGTVSVHTLARVEIDRVHYHSSEMDMRLEDMSAEIAGKAGVRDFSAEKDLEGEQVFGAGWNTMWVENHRHAIVKFEFPVLEATGEIGCIFRADAETYTQGYRLTIDNSNYLKFYRYDGEWILIEKMLIPFTPSGTVTMSAQTEGHFSVWVAGRFVHSFVDTTYTDGDYLGIVVKENSTVDVDISALDRRVDNYILDMGARGTQLLGQLLGPKRVMFLDSPTGGLRMARVKAVGLTEDYTVPDVVARAGYSEFDTEQRTLVRAEGYEIAEVADYDAISEHGLLFIATNAIEANDMWESKEEANAVLIDTQSASYMLSLEGAIDPRVEPNDKIKVTTNAGDAVVIVDGVRFIVNPDQQDAICDMSLETRYAIA